MTDDLVKRLRAIDKDIILRRFDPEMSFDGMTAHKAANRIEKLETALREIIGALNDPRGGQHVYDMHNASYIARKALEEKDD